MRNSGSGFSIDSGDMFEDMLADAAAHEENIEGDTSSYFNPSQTTQQQDQSPQVTTPEPEPTPEPVYEESPWKAKDTQEQEPSPVEPEPVEEVEPERFPEPVEETVSTEHVEPEATVEVETPQEQPSDATERRQGHVYVPEAVITPTRETKPAETNTGDMLVSNDKLETTVNVVLEIVNAYRGIPEKMRHQVAQFVCRTDKVEEDDEKRVILEAIRTEEDERRAVVNLHNVLLEKERHERVFFIMALNSNDLELLGRLASSMAGTPLPENASGNSITFARAVELMVDRIPEETIEYISYTSSVLAAAVDE